MIKWLPLVFLLMAFTPIYDKHETTEKVDNEFKEIEQTVQPKQWATFSSTPIVKELSDKQVVIVSSQGWSTIMWRDNNEIYSIRGSCSTVLR